MKVRLPLYARILGLFLLNVLVLAGAFLVVFRIQFHLGLDSFLAGQASERIRALSQVIIGELQESQVGRENDVLDRFAEAYHLELYLFRADGVQLAGEGVTLPSEIEGEIRRPRAGQRRGGFGFGPQESNPMRDSPPPPVLPPRSAPPVTGSSNAFSEAAGPPPRVGEPSLRGPGNPQGGRRFGQRWQGAELPPRITGGFFLKTRRPTRYWAGTFFPGRNFGSPGQPLVLLIVSETLSGGGLFFDTTPWIIAGSGALVLSALLWLPFVRRMTHALGEMTQTTERISVGQFEARVATRRGDELGRLAEAINRMSVRLEGLVSGQKRFLGDIAHELCSPLARIQTALGILEQRAQGREDPYLKDLQAEAEHMSNLVGELLSFSKASLHPSTRPLRPTRLLEVVRHAVQREQVEGVDIEQAIPEPLTVEADPELLQRAIANLIRNAIRHASAAGPITITARPQGNEVVVEVTDCGPGAPEESLEKLFDPFYRVDESRTRETGGVGLGLTIVKTCVESCDGTVTAKNRLEGGLLVQIRLKAASSKTD